MDREDGLLEANLFQIPSCSICLQLLSNNVSSLACGHCFHLECIMQHFEYQGVCPNCKKRAHNRQIRNTIFTVTKNTRANAYLQRLLSSLNISQKKQVEQLLTQIKNESTKVQKMTGQIYQNNKQLKKKDEQLSKLKEQQQKHRRQLLQYYKMNKENHRSIEDLSDKLRESQRSEARLRNQLDRYHREEKQFNQVKRLKNLLNQNSQQLVAYKAQLDNNQTQPQEKARLFFQLLQMKNLQCVRNKEKYQEAREQYGQADNMIKKLKNGIEEWKKKFRESEQKRTSQRKKYQELKVKYRTVLDKAKLKGIKQLPQFEDSINFNSNPFKSKIPETNLIKTETNLIKTETQMKLQFPTATSKKPGFSGSTIGGFKKKDSTVRNY